MVEELKKYFDSTSKEKILADWNSTEHCDSVGITVEEFLSNNIKIQEKLQNDKDIE